MGDKGGKVNCCGLWVQRSNPGCYSLFEQSSGVGSREARLPPINGWQVLDKRLTAYALPFLLFTTFFGWTCRCQTEFREYHDNSIFQNPGSELSHAREQF